MLFPSSMISGVVDALKIQIAGQTDGTVVAVFKNGYGSHNLSRVFADMCSISLHISFSAQIRKKVKQEVG